VCGLVASSPTDPPAGCTLASTHRAFERLKPVFHANLLDETTHPRLWHAGSSKTRPRWRTALKKDPPGTVRRFRRRNDRPRKMR